MNSHSPESDDHNSGPSGRADASSPTVGQGKATVPPPMDLEDRLHQAKPIPAGGASDPPPMPYLVCIGASAGGLEALERLLSKAGPTGRLAYIVVQHLSPDFDSLMDSLLQRVTALPVREIENGEAIMSDRVYLLPPGVHATIDNFRFRLKPRESEAGPSHPIDLIFSSAAMAAGRRMIATVLSGTGTDGSRGIIDVADAGGLVLIQRPELCKFDAMPVNAENTGRVHLTLDPLEMPVTYERFANASVDAAEFLRRIAEEGGGQGVTMVLDRLRQRHQIDFQHYKPSTVQRRIQRRLEMSTSETLEEYAETLEHDQAESNELYRDLLIGVTQFFRDYAAFEHLEQHVIPDLVRRESEAGIRIWVCGCATGEEAYSLAILFIEAIRRSGREIDFKMFATDAHRESLQFAATGIYPEKSLRDVSEVRRQEFFNRRSDGYYVKSELRRHIVFAPHDVVSDPPFTQMSMVSCRNLLIYLQADSQRRIMALFHFALRHAGILFLGPSETTSSLEDEFEPLHSNWRIFQKRRDVRLPVNMRIANPGSASSETLSVRQTGGNTRERTHLRMSSMYAALLEDLMPRSLVIDGQLKLVHAFEGAQPFLRYPSGRPTDNVMELIEPSLKTTLSAAIRQARSQSGEVVFDGLRHPSETKTAIRISIRSVSVPPTGELAFVVQFEDRDDMEAEMAPPRVVDLSPSNNSQIELLEQDLSHTRQSLQSTIEELETSNEVLQATNEEMVAANEELQSTNEELQSVNQELYTVNAEHQKRMVELDEANADMNNLLASTRVGVVFLDPHLYIRRFTPEVARMLYLESHDIGRSIEGFVSRLADDDFLIRLQRVMEDRHEEEWEVESENRNYLVRAMPYWKRGEIGGVVISFVDVSSLRRAETAAVKFKMMADVNVEAQALLDESGNVVYGNEKMAANLGVEVSDLIGSSVFGFDKEYDAAAYSENFDRIVSEGGMTFETVHHRRDGSTFPVEITATAVEIDGEMFLFATIRDITARRAAESQRRLLEKAIGSIENGILILDPTKEDRPITFANNGFQKMTGYDEAEVLEKGWDVLVGEQSDPDTVQAVQSAIDAGTSYRGLIINCRKNGEPFWNDFYITQVRDAKDEITHVVGVLNDVTDRIIAGENARNSERTIRSLLDSTAEGIFGLDTEGICTFCNPSAADILGYENSEALVGRDMLGLLQPQDASGNSYRETDSAILQAIQRNQNDERRDEVFFRADGRALPVHWWCHPIQSGDKCIGGVVTFVDDTERKRFEQELRDARDIADAANMAKSRFLANMSHELRTPLSAILGFARILHEENADEEQQEKLRIIQRNGDYLLRLLNDVLDLSRIEAGKFSASPTSVRLVDLLSDVRNTMNMRTVEYDSQLFFELTNPLPPVITTDSARLRQILINLIANALKFSPGGEARVRVSFRDEGSDSRIRFEVEDTGIGMSPETLKNLFQPFVQANASIAQRFGGTGLGLSITRRLVEAMSGAISVQSELDNGSTFTVEVPVHPSEPPVELTLDEEGAPSATEIPTRRKRSKLADVKLEAKVLIADDMRDVRFIAQHFLRKADCEVDVAENGALAVEKIKAAIEIGQPYDLVLMDMQMPVMDGAEAVRELRSQQIDVPVIALTADAMKGTRRRLLAAGFDEYLSKPLDVERLMRVAVALLD